MQNKPTKEYVRENFPKCSSIADEFRAVFGPGVKVLAMSEDGKQIGKFSDNQKMKGK